MKFGELEEECIGELGQELKDLAKQYLKDAKMNFDDHTRSYENSKKCYEDLLDTEIDKEFLSKKGIYVKNSNDRR